jgi:hypothetical protein
MPTAIRAHFGKLYSICWRLQARHPPRSLEHFNSDDIRIERKWAYVTISGDPTRLFAHHHDARFDHGEKNITIACIV